MNKNKVIKNLANACLKLDRLQVELCKETPYKVPDLKETRNRILEVMAYLEVVAKEVGLSD